ncbi:ATP-dependent RNA helicase HrpB, partial [Bacillus thuringiensis]|nr:ATP-dependent RNA helicase HrpB [Bacillus thuringiensis]
GPPAYQQLKVFHPTPKGSRKVIVSTNIAETSVTIHGIKHVIDSGMVKAKSYKAASGLDLLRVQRVSQAQAWQRTGRAGREAPG